MLPPEIWIKIAMCSPRSSLCDELRGTDEHTFNALVRAVPSLGRWTIAGHNGDIVGRRLDLMIMFGYSIVCERTMGEDLIRWYKDGLLHRNDQPAIIGVVTCCWYYHGARHRRDGPAVQTGSYWFMWLQHGAHHRDDGPSSMYDTSCVSWCKNGMSHRDVMPAVIYVAGEMVWYRDGLMIDRR